MRTVAIGMSCLAIIATAAAAQTERRELGPHVHGAGTLAIAIEGNKLSMELSAPANDILGFEHQPSTSEQSKILAEAKSDLGQPLKLIELPAAADCAAESANVVFNAAEPKADAKPAAESHEHADFDVDYVIVCKAADKIAALTFPYFKRFPGAQKLTVTVSSDKGQTQFDVTRDSPSHDLK